MIRVWYKFIDIINVKILFYRFKKLGYFLQKLIQKLRYFLVIYSIYKEIKKEEEEGIIMPKVGEAQL